VCAFIGTSLKNSICSTTRTLRVVYDCPDSPHKRKSPETARLEPLSEVEGALLVVKVLHAPHPELGGLLLVGGEHFCVQTDHSVSTNTPHYRQHHTRPCPPVRTERWLFALSSLRAQGSLDWQFQPIIAPAAGAREDAHNCFFCDSKQPARHSYTHAEVEYRA